MEKNLLYIYITDGIDHSLQVSLCFVVAWTFVLSLAWSLWTMLRDTVKRAARMHQIPCANCQFFTRDYHLKCTVHPYIALSEAAIGYPDYQEKANSFTASTVEPFSQESKLPSFLSEWLKTTSKITSDHKEI